MNSLGAIVQRIRRHSLRSAAGSAAHRFRTLVCKPGIAITGTDVRRETLGSRHGGWTFLQQPHLQNATVISCGAGEDITFDVAMAARFDATVVVVDPTPRAVSHVRAALTRLGQPALRAYADGGAQPVEAYDLSRLRSGQIRLVETALWVEAGTVKFFPPKNADHVSHSIVDIQNGGAADASLQAIEVPAATLREIMGKAGVADFALLKLDIEGAEIQVIPEILRDGLRPPQILVEFDGLNFPSPKAIKDVEGVDALLRQSGYLCYHSNGRANFLYAIPEDVAI
jgi:FkbM family methyltransferase